MYDNEWVLDDDLFFVDIYEVHEDPADAVDTV